MSNGDGTYLTATVTITDAQGRFTLSINNGSVRVARVTYFDPEPIPVSIQPGVTSVPTGNRRWGSVSTSFSSA